MNYMIPSMFYAVVLLTGPILNPIEIDDFHSVEVSFFVWSAVFILFTFYKIIQDNINIKNEEYVRFFKWSVLFLSLIHI